MANANLIEKYPFLKVYGPDGQEVQCDITWLDSVPAGWVQLFLEACDQVKSALLSCDGMDTYRITDVKEKFGSLHVYDYAPDGPESVSGIWLSADAKSARTCIDCGKPAKWLTTGWIVPLCDECMKKTPGTKCQPIDAEET